MGDQSVASALFDVLFVLQVSPELRLEHVSESSEEFTGYRAQEYLDDSSLWVNALDVRDREAVLAALNAAPAVATHLTLRWSRRAGLTMSAIRMSICSLPLAW